MKDMQLHLEKLRTDAAECGLIRALATDPAKRELFTRLAAHLEAKNKRTELELKLTRYRELGRQVYDPKTLRCIDSLIAEFEQKLREMDE